MSVATPNDGNLDNAGEANANSQASQDTSQPLPEYIKTIMGRLDEQDKLIKGTQKGTDKQIGQVRNDLKRILELKDKGLTESEIKRELWIDQQIEGTNTPAEPVATGSSAASKMSLDFQNIDSALELPVNDSRVTDLKLKFGSDPTAYLREAVKLQGSLKTNQPTPAEGLLPSGSAISSTVDNPKVIRLNSLLANPSANRDEIRKLKKELDSVGWK